MATRKNIAEQAAALRAELKANVDDLYADRITHTEFSERNRAIWARIQVSRSLDDAVCSMLNGEK